MNSLLIAVTVQAPVSAPEQTRHRPKTTPACYLGRPAGVWMGTIHPKRTATVRIRSDGAGDRAESASRAEARR
jgi:hypothetical protein